MQLLNNISDHQKIVFGDPENSILWCFQNADNQYRYNCKITPNSTGKELDAETGYSYFGARYLDHTLTTAWLSVDPMADKYPSISPYAYCAWNPIKLVDPNGDTLCVTNKKGDFLFSLDDNSTEIKTITAKELYDNGIQWFEPNADNYMPLLTVNSEINSIEGIDHFSWNEIENFAFTDRLMIEYRQGGSGDFKSRYAKYYLCTVDGIPYWTDVIGQIPFTINCYKTQLMNGKSHSEAAKITQYWGHVFARGFPSVDNLPNNADNWMIKRVCDWARKGLVVGDVRKCGRYHYYSVNRSTYKFNKLAQWNLISR